MPSSGTVCRECLQSRVASSRMPDSLQHAAFDGDGLERSKGLASQEVANRFQWWL